MGNLYLIPNRLGETAINTVLPPYVVDVVRKINVLATEDIKNTCRFLKAIDKNIIIEEYTFLELNEHSSRQTLEEILPWLEKGDIGVISEAGCPGIADPGAELVALAHRKGYRVIPLVGPSSILLALIASGCNGQNFSFNGYLPVKPHERAHMLKQYEKLSRMEKRTQIFIETPYRNEALFQQILDVLSPETQLSIARDITTESEYIKTKRIREWKKEKPELHKHPAVFILYAYL